MLDIFLYYSLIFDSDNDVTIHIVADKCVHLVQLKLIVTHNSSQGTVLLLHLYHNIRISSNHLDSAILVSGSSFSALL